MLFVLHCVFIKKKKHLEVTQRGKAVKGLCFSPPYGFYSRLVASVFAPLYGFV